MNVTYRRDATGGHQSLTIFVNGANAGTLTVRTGEETWLLDAIQDLLATSLEETTGPSIGQLIDVADAHVPPEMFGDPAFQHYTNELVRARDDLIISMSPEHWRIKSKLITNLFGMDAMAEAVGS